MWVLLEGSNIIGSGEMLPHDGENPMQVQIAATDLVHRLLPEIKLDGGEIEALTSAVTGRGFPYFAVYVRYYGDTSPRVYYLEQGQVGMLDRAGDDVPCGCEECVAARNTPI